MRKLLFILAFLPFTLFGQAIVGTKAITYTAGVPTHTPSILGAWVSMDTTTAILRKYNFSTGAWDVMGVYNEGLQIVGNNLRITDDAGMLEVSLSAYLDNTDDQQLTISNDTITLEDGGFVVLPPSAADSSLFVTLSHLQDSTAAIRADFPIGGGADSSIFVTLTHLQDTAAAIRGDFPTGFLEWSDTSVLATQYYVNDQGFLTDALQWSDTSVLVTLTHLQDTAAAIRGDFPVNTDNQTVDTLSLSGTTLTLALENDGEAPYTVDLASLQDGTGTDDQVIDTFELVGNTLRISLEDDGEAAKEVDMSSIAPDSSLYVTLSHLQDTAAAIRGDFPVDTDNQTVDTFSLSGTTLTLALEDDNESPYTVDLSSLQDGTGTDDQNLSVTGSGPTYVLDIEDGNDVTISASGIATLSEPSANELRITATEVDGSTTNELQTLSWSAGTGGQDEITLSDGGGTVTITDNVDDADASPTNEIQDLSYTAATGAIGISSGTGTTIPVMTASVRGLTPDGDGAGTDEFLREDGTWAAPPDTDTQLSQEQVEDYAGAMTTLNTETLITVTYQDADGTIDYVVDNNLANYSNATSGFLIGNQTITLSGDVTGSGATSITTALATGSVDANELVSTAVTPGAYTNASITVDADGRITAASSGAGGAATGDLSALSVYKTTDQTMTASYAAITTWDTPETEDAPFTMNTTSGVIVIDSAGRYLISANMQIYSTGTRCIGFLKPYVGLGSGLTALSLQSAAYARGTASPDNLYYASAAQTFYYDFAAGDSLVFRTKYEGQAGDIQDMNILIFKMEGVEGPAGPAGADAQGLTYTASTGEMAISGGTSATIPVMTTTVRGLVPDGDGAGTDEFLREDGTWGVPPGTGVTSVSGTTNRITSTGGSTPVIDIAATYVGQTSLTTLGTIATGTWQGTILSPTYGGTGINNASRTLTLNTNSGALTFPTAGTYTFPNAATATLARTDAAQTFTGVQTMTSPSFTTSVVTGSTTFAAFNTTATTLNLGGASTTLNMGGTPTGALTANFYANATSTGVTKAINIGTGGASGSITNIRLGSATAGATGTTFLESVAVNLSETPTTNATFSTSHLLMREVTSGNIEKVAASGGGTSNFLRADGTWAAPAGGVGGSGTTSYIPKFTASTTLGNSLIYDNGTNIGIGTTSPGGKFTISSTGGVNSGINLTATSASSYGVIDFNTNGGLAGQFLATGSTYSNGIFTGNQIALAQYLNSGKLTLVAGGTGSYINFATGGYALANERMRITSAGLVGIGTDTPVELLTVAGTGSFTGDVTVPDEAYGAGWNASTEVPTKNAVYDEIESLPTLASGTYTPTLTGTANVASSTAYVCQYMRVGTVVTVSGKVEITPTSANTYTELGMTLPISSNLTADEQCSGSGGGKTSQVTAALIMGDATNDRAEIEMRPGAGSQTYYFTYTYQLL